MDVIDFPADYKVVMNRNTPVQKEELTDILVLESAYMCNPRFEWKSFVIQELIQRIEECRKGMGKINADYENYDPNIFHLYISRKVEEKEQIAEKLQKSALQIRSSVNANLFEFKKQVNDKLFDDMNKGTDNVVKTHTYLTTLNERVIVYKEQVERLKAQVESNSMGNEMKEQRVNAKREGIAMLKEKIIEKRAELKAQKKRQEKFKNLKNENELKMKELTANMCVLLESIERNKEFQNQHCMTEPETFRHNKEQLQFAFALYGWIPQKI